MARMRNVHNGPRTPWDAKEEDLPQAPDALRQSVLAQQNELLARRRKVKEAARMPEVRSRAVPAWRKHGGTGGGHKLEQRKMIKFLIRNERGRFHDPARHVGQGPAARMIDSRSDDILSAVMERLEPEQTGRKEIEREFFAVWKEYLPDLKGAQEAADRLRSEGDEMKLADAQAMQQLADAQKPAPPKENLPDGLKRDSNGWLRYTRNNPWDKTPGARAPESILEDGG